MSSFKIPTTSASHRSHPYPHRPAATPIPNDSHTSTSSSYNTTQSSSGNIATLSNQVPLYPIFSQLKIHVVPTKLDGELTSIYAQIEALGGTLCRIEDSSFAVTVLKGRPRLEAVLGKPWVDRKHILSVQMVKDCYDNCLKYGETFPISTSNGNGVGGITSYTSAGSSKEIYIPPPAFRPRSIYLIKGTGPPTPEKQGEDLEQEEREDDLKPFGEDIAFEEIPKRAVMRCSPLVCVNQDIIDAIKPIFESRIFDNPDQRNANVLSYKRSMSILKSVPRRIKSGKEASRLVDLGPKVAERIDEFLSTGFIQESQDILSSSRFAALNLFSSIFTVGHSKAVELYDRHGCRTLDDLKDYYARKEEKEWDSGVVGEGIPVGKVSNLGGKRASTGETKKRRSRDEGKRRREGRMSQAEIVREWCELRDEIDQKIPREEVHEIGLCVQQHLDILQPGCRYTLTGGYRRGKSESNDVDVVFCPPEDGLDEGLLKRLYLRLGAFGIVTHVLQLTGSSIQVQSHNNFDGLDKAFVLFKLPPKFLSNGKLGPMRLTRRVDLISAPKARYATAVLGWSGSEMFERDLRRHAEKEHGMKFDSGSFRFRNTGEEVFCNDEREIFKRLGLKWVHPRWRNANG